MLKLTYCNLHHHLLLLSQPNKHPETNTESCRIIIRNCGDRTSTGVKNLGKYHSSNIILATHNYTLQFIAVHRWAVYMCRRLWGQKQHLNMQTLNSINEISWKLVPRQARKNQEQKWSICGFSIIKDLKGICQQRYACAAINCVPAQPAEKYNTPIAAMHPAVHLWHIICQFGRTYEPVECVGRNSARQLSDWIALWDMLQQTMVVAEATHCEIVLVLCK